jgi:flagellar basal-body rod protein FlgB
VKTLFEGVDQMERAMTFHRERHGVLAGNLSNLDTPGYQPKDLERITPPAPSANALPVEKTDAAHLDAGAISTDEMRVFSDPAETVSADGNAVNLEREMSKIAANRVRYSTTTELASRRLSLLRYAAGDGNGG